MLRDVLLNSGTMSSIAKAATSVSGLSLALVDVHRSNVAIPSMMYAL